MDVKKIIEALKRDNLISVTEEASLLHASGQEGFFFNHSSKDSPTLADRPDSITNKRSIKVEWGYSNLTGTFKDSIEYII